MKLSHFDGVVSEKGIERIEFTVFSFCFLKIMKNETTKNQ